MGDKNIFLWLALYALTFILLFGYRLIVKKDWYRWWSRPIFLIIFLSGVITLIMSFAGLLGFIEP